MIAELSGGTAPSHRSMIVVDDDSADVCAGCGKISDGEGGSIKLKNCTACRLVKYCGVDCQKTHRKQHKKACKQRVAELKDEELYSQGHERPEGDFCPICTLPIPFPMGKHSVFNVCCMNRVCNGCVMATRKRGMSDCLFCRTPISVTDAERLAKVQARVEKKDPVAVNFLGEKYTLGIQGLQKDMRKAVELYTEAAELGSVAALSNLARVYHRGEGIEEDKAKSVYFYEKAALKGHAQSRRNLGIIEVKKGNYNRAVRHLLISAKMGYKESLESIKVIFMQGLATKEQYAQALKGYQDAVEDMKNQHRDEAKRLS